MTKEQFTKEQIVEVLATYGPPRIIDDFILLIGFCLLITYLDWLLSSEYNTIQLMWLVAGGWLTTQFIRHLWKKRHRPK